MGGIETDKWGATSLSGLFAVGEVSAGAHGANRLAGNALAEVFSMGSLVGEKAADLAKNIGSPFPIQEAVDDEKKRLEREFSGEGESQAIDSAIEGADVEQSRDFPRKE